MFKVDHNDAFSGGVENGTYEVVLYHANEDATKSGAEFINIDLIIRNDVNQKYQNAHIFHRIWKTKATNEYNSTALNTIAKAIQLPNGKDYNTINELLQDFLIKTCQVTVKNEESEYNGQTYNNLNVKAWGESKITGPLQHQFKKKENDLPPVEVNESNLPF
ncbi:DUF669 domain-containing protein [Listeria monocytogenes]